MNEENSAVQEQSVRERKGVSKETAEEQFEMWLDYYGLKFSDIEIEDGEKAAKTLKNGLVRAIIDGHLEVEIRGDGMSVTQYLKNPTKKGGQFIFADRVMAAQLASDKESSKQPIHRQRAFMASLAHVPASEFVHLKGVDATVFGRISMIFSLV